MKAIVNRSTFSFRAIIDNDKVHNEAADIKESKDLIEKILKENEKFRCSPFNLSDNKTPRLENEKYKTPRLLIPFIDEDEVERKKNEAADLKRTKESIETTRKENEKFRCSLRDPLIFNPLIVSIDEDDDLSVDGDSIDGGGSNVKASVISEYSELVRDTHNVAAIELGNKVESAAKDEDEKKVGLFSVKQKSIALEIAAKDEDDKEIGLFSACKMSFRGGSKSTKRHPTRFVGLSQKSVDTLAEINKNDKFEDLEFSLLDYDESPTHLVFLPYPCGGSEKDNLKFDDAFEKDYPSTHDKVWNSHNDYKSEYEKCCNCARYGLEKKNERCIIALPPFYPIPDLSTPLFINAHITPITTASVYANSENNSIKTPLFDLFISAVKKNHLPIPKLSTKKINEFKYQEDVDAAMESLQQAISDIEKTCKSENNSYLENFSKKIKLAEVNKNLDRNSIVTPAIDFHNIVIHFILGDFGVTNVFFEIFLVLLSLGLELIQIFIVIAYGTEILYPSCTDSEDCPSGTDCEALLCSSENKRRITCDFIDNNLKFVRNDWTLKLTILLMAMILASKLMNEVRMALRQERYIVFSNVSGFIHTILATFMRCVLIARCVAFSILVPIVSAISLLSKEVTHINVISTTLAISFILETDNFLASCLPIKIKRDIRYNQGTLVDNRWGSSGIEAVIGICCVAFVSLMTTPTGVLFAAEFGSLVYPFAEKGICPYIAAGFFTVIAPYLLFLMMIYFIYRIGYHMTCGSKRCCHYNSWYYADILIELGGVGIAVFWTFYCVKYFNDRGGVADIEALVILSVLGIFIFLCVGVSSVRALKGF